jgi:lipoyl(octanoyl) transferase
MEMVSFRDLGELDYQTAWDYQEDLLQENVQKKSAAAKVVQQSTNEIDAGGQRVLTAGPETQNYLLFVDHPPVYTLGKSGRLSNLLLSEEELLQRNIGFFKTNRGGDITYHGPGQVVGYPILDLEKFGTDIGKYLRNLEEVILLTLAEYGIFGERSPGETGVWIDASVKGRERKICAIGVRCSRWITMHGFAFNVNTDLEYFHHIIPCGIEDKQVTSLEKELGRPVEMGAVKEKIRKNFERVFCCRIIHSMP